MNTFKKYLLALMLTVTTANLLPDHGGFGAGVATGAILGTGLGVAATRDPYYYDGPVVGPVVYDDYYDYDYYPRHRYSRYSSRSVSPRTRTYVNRR